jgi:hypothetical protein
MGSIIPTIRILLRGLFFLLSLYTLHYLVGKVYRQTVTQNQRLHRLFCNIRHVAALFWDVLYQGMPATLCVMVGVPSINARPGKFLATGNKEKLRRNNIPFLRNPYITYIVNVLFSEGTASISTLSGCGTSPM